MSLTRHGRPSNDGTIHIVRGRFGAFMALWEISLRAQLDYPFIRMSSHHPGIPFSMWCIWGRELIQVPTLDEHVLASVEKEIKGTGRIIEKWVEAGDTKIFMLRCTCGHVDHSPWNLWEQHEFFDAPPAVYQDGWGYFRLLTFEEDRTRALFRELNKLGASELIRKRELTLNVLPTSIWVTSLFTDLTVKQMDAVLKAHRYGYYVSPREITTEAIAKGVGVSRSTFEEHLRKAENRIMANLVPYLQLYFSGEKKPERLPEKATRIEIPATAE